MLSCWIYINLDTLSYIANTVMLDMQQLQEVNITAETVNVQVNIKKNAKNGLSFATMS